MQTSAEEQRSKRTNKIFVLIAKRKHENTFYVVTCIKSWRISDWNSCQNCFSFSFKKVTWIRAWISVCVHKASVIIRNGIFFNIITESIGHLRKRSIVPQSNTLYVISKSLK